MAGLIPFICKRARYYGGKKRQQDEPGSRRQGSCHGAKHQPTPHARSEPPLESAHDRSATFYWIVRCTAALSSLRSRFRIQTSRPPFIAQPHIASVWVVIRTPSRSPNHPSLNSGQCWQRLRSHLECSSEDAGPIEPQAFSTGGIQARLGLSTRPSAS